jgi:hypothetical protein
MPELFSFPPVFMRLAEEMEANIGGMVNFFDASKHKDVLPV